MTRRIGFLHTGAANVDTFTRLLAEIDPDAIGAHVLDEALLDDARRLGVNDPGLAERVGARLREVAEGSDAVLCTCSSIGAVAEAMSQSLGLPALRVDRPMAAAAVQTGARIGVVAAVESTLGPTRELLQQEARSQGRAVSLVEIVCGDAWSAFESGDLDAYLDQIAACADRLAPSVDVVVLAQASMAPAADRCTTDRPVLTSPRAGVHAVLAAIGYRHDRTGRTPPITTLARPTRLRRE